jgi:hypothetical protein
VTVLLGCSAGDQTSGSRGAAGTTPSRSSGSAGAAAAKTSAAIPGGNVATNGAIPGPVDAGHAIGAPAQPGTTKGAFKPAAQLDPNVKFDWQETTAAGANQCQAGTYTGAFGCSLGVDPDSGVPPLDAGDFQFAGPITLVFTKSADGEFLELNNAKIDGSANDTLGFMGDLVGRLDCSTLEFSATVSNGVYGLGSPILLPTGDVIGTLSGKLSSQTGQLNGTWSLTSSSAGDSGLFNCFGPWQVTLKP